MRQVTACGRLLLGCVSIISLALVSAAAQTCNKPADAFEYHGGKTRFVIDPNAINIQTDIQQYVRQRYGKNTRIADWQQIKSLSRADGEISRFIRSLHLDLQTNNHACGNYLVSNQGETHVEGMRYLLTRHDGSVPPGWTSLDNANSHQIDLGRWNWPGYPIIAIPLNEPVHKLEVTAANESANAVPSASARNAQPNACPTLLRTDPDVLRVVNGFAQGSARNPRMTANQTVDFIAANITREVASSSPTLVNRNPALFYRSFEHVTGAMIASCWPALNAVIVEKEFREAVASMQERNAVVEREKQEREAEAALAEQRRKQAAIEAQPSTKLLRAYRSYIGVRQCFDARKGYAAVYINDEQVADAKTRVLAIERTMKAVDPTIDPDVVWKRANEPETDTAPTNEIAAVLLLADAVGKRWVSSPNWVDESDDYCKRSYSALTDQYTATVPSSNVVKKDF